MEEEINDKQAEQIIRNLVEQKSNKHTFLTNVVKSDDTTKTGNLIPEELGDPKLPLRTYKELSLFCNEVWGQSEWGDYFTKQGEILTSTSLSKDAIIIKLAVTDKSEMADTTPKEKGSNKGWFKKKN
ncbi:MAG TPA: hypothetical protein ENH46_04900 [Candidatus Pacearchaeota archaeon]|nr:hypothetical protein [Candidatus Pacearchaeota archaeon]